MILINLNFINFLFFDTSITKIHMVVGHRKRGRKTKFPWLKPRRGVGNHTLMCNLNFTIEIINVILIKDAMIVFYRNVT